MGNPNKIIFRSSWELNVCKFFDSSAAVVRWASEEVKIGYISPTDGKRHIYHPDFLAAIIDAQGITQQILIEVKPLKETDIKFAKTAAERDTIIVNYAKWDAARAFASLNGLKFQVITELDIFKLVPPKPKKNKIKKTLIKKPITTRKSIRAKK
jgi:hypothetical protein